MCTSAFSPSSTLRAFTPLFFCVCMWGKAFRKEFAANWIKEPSWGRLLYSLFLAEERDLFRACYFVKSQAAMEICSPPWARPGPRRGDPSWRAGAAGGCWGRGTRAGEGRGAALQDVFICNLVLFIVLRRYLIESLWSWVQKCRIGKVIASFLVSFGWQSHIFWQCKGHVVRVVSR